MGLDPWRDITVKMSGLSHARSTKSLVDRTEDIYRQVERLVNELYAMGDFGARWKRIRSIMPLQLRLVAEQIFYDRGDAWKVYIGGFGPLADSPSKAVVAQKSKTTIAKPGR